MLLNTPTVDTGWTAADFTLPDFDGNSVTLDSVKGQNGFLVAFICNHCPYVKAIADRFVQDAAILASQNFGVVAINSNDYLRYPDDSPPKMKEFAGRHGFDFPYLVDEDQSVGRAYDAVCTPDFFGFDANSQLRYRGRLDDARMANADNRVAELVNAMQQIARTGEGPVEQHPSMGCSIKWRS
ncbi:MAG: thioredoxin family protein [Pseudomonadota bacterium]